MRLIGVALFLLLGACPGLALSSINARCSACRAVTDVLVGRLEAEVPRNHLDMRHRVGPDGKRWGKVIAYQMSELRVIELLDNLCDEMNMYELAPGGEADGGRPQRWVHSDTRIDKHDRLTQQLKQERKELGNYCADLLERHEDALSDGLRQGLMDSDTSSDFLCLTTAKHCEQTLAEEEQQEEAYAAAVAEAEAAEAKAAEAAAAEAAEKDAQQQPEAGASAEGEAESDSPQQVEL